MALRNLAIAACGALGLFASVAPAGAAPKVPGQYLYWANTSGGVESILGCNTSIGRARVDGTQVNQSFRDAVFPEAIAVNDRFVFRTGGRTTEEPRTFLDRSPLDWGDALDQSSSLAKIASAQDPPGQLAADKGYVYWAHGSSIGRADAAGSAIIPGFLDAGGQVDDVAVDGQFLYWVADGSIGRANLDGSGANPTFIAGTVRTRSDEDDRETKPLGDLDADRLAVTGQFVFWRAYDGSIGRANLDGGGVVRNLVTGIPGGSFGIAADGAHLYWVSGAKQIARANLDGGAVEPAFVKTAYITRDIAIGSGFADEDPGVVAEASRRAAIGQATARLSGRKVRRGKSLRIVASAGLKGRRVTVRWTASNGRTTSRTVTLRSGARGAAGSVNAPRVKGVYRVTIVCCDNNKRIGAGRVRVV